MTYQGSKICYKIGINMNNRTHMDYHKPNYAGFVAISAVPVGSSFSSLQQALEILLEGACYNIKDIESDSIIEKLHWKRAFDKKLIDKEWINFLEGRGYRSGIGSPISLFYRYEYFRKHIQICNAK